jgi:PAS domain S-box-containing protein
MNNKGDKATGPDVVAARRDVPAAEARIAELEAEVAGLRAVLAQTGLSAERFAGLDANELAHERTDHAADAGLARLTAATAEARHGREMAAGRADLVVSKSETEALRSAYAALAESRAALREREERLHLILDSAADYAIFTTDLNRRITSWNAGAERVLGWAESEIIGRPIDVIFTPEDRTAGRPEREAAIALAKGRANNERWHLRKDGTHQRTPARSALHAWGARARGVSCPRRCMWGSEEHGGVGGTGGAAGRRAARAARLRVTAA